MPNENSCAQQPRIQAIEHQPPLASPSPLRSRRSAAEDRRAHPRAPLRRVVDYVHLGRVQHGILEDLSESGLRLWSHNNLGRASSVKVFVPVPQPSGRAVLWLIEGLIAWRTDIELGVRFTRPALAGRLQVRAFVRRGGAQGPWKTDSRD